MKISVVSKVPYPRQQVWEAMRDHMPDLADHLPNVKSIEVLERDEPGDGLVKLLNKWTAADTEIPAVARPFVDPSKTSWLDRAEWTDADFTTRWSLEMQFMPDRVTCDGTTTYHEVGDGTEMRIQGELTLELKGLVPRLMVGKVTPKVESFVIKMVEPNFQQTAEGLRKYLDSQG